MNEVALKQEGITLPENVEAALIQGNLAQLSPTDRVRLYNETCTSLGLNPLTKPFDYIQLNGKLTLYCLKSATEQLRKIHGVSITDLKSTLAGDVHVVTAYAKDKTGRTDTATGAVTVGHLKGDSLANALMRCETKAKRRVTLSICGLGVLDETELDTIPNVKVEKFTEVVPAEAVSIGSQSHDEAMEKMRQDPFPKEYTENDAIEFAPDVPDGKYGAVVEAGDDQIKAEFFGKLKDLKTKKDMLELWTIYSANHIKIMGKWWADFAKLKDGAS